MAQKPVRPHPAEAVTYPLFPELQTAPEEARELAPTGLQYVAGHYRQIALSGTKGWQNCNLRT